MLRYAATTFLGAFLLFQVQPLIAKVILPWFGGSPSVWSTCMLFFQVLLLGGYCYAHILTAKLEGRSQALIHTALLVVALGSLPILPHSYWKPSGSENPTFRILLLLLVTIGLPYFLLSSTGPLVQRWFSVARPNRSPYRLYALSNIGSVAALLTFPFLFEPLFSGAALAWSWSIGFAGFALLCGLTAWKALGSKAAEAPPLDAVARERVAPVAGRRIVLWLALAALPSTMLLAVTNVLCQDIAVVPFLWVAPLTVYLVTFILCFDSDRWYRRNLFAPLLGVVGPLALLVTYLVEKEVHNALTSLPMQIAVFSALLFLCGMVCHGELVAKRPGAGRLTLFYVCVSAGGAIGGVFVALIAPLLFTNYVELWLGAAACTVAAFYALFQSGLMRSGSKPLVRWGLPAAMTAGLFGSITLHIANSDHAVVSQTRGFFGRMRVYEYLALKGQGRDAKVIQARSLSHGHTLHGLQYLGDERRYRPTTYYVEDAGVGVAMEFVRKEVAPARAKAGEPTRIGVIGLGAGTLACYTGKGDEVVFYDIQPEVIAAAEEHFTYLEDARQRGAKVETVLGDARIQMERELKAGGRQYDILVLDAFSSDAIPKHLLTKECGELYWSHMREDGLLAVHISNRYLDLLPVVRGLAEDAGKEWRLFVVTEQTESQRASVWVVVTSNRKFLDAEKTLQRAKLPREGADPLLWTDDFSSLWHVLR
jgi:hypothetical protein